MSPALPMVATKLALWLGCRCSWSAQCPLLSYGGPQRADVSEGAAWQQGDPFAPADAENLIQRDGGERHNPFPLSVDLSPPSDPSEADRFGETQLELTCCCDALSRSW